MEYRTFADLSKLIRDNLTKVPHDIDVVVGIPRSGMLPASMLATYLNVPLTDIDSFVKGFVYSCGISGKNVKSPDEIKKVLVVDDSISSGKSLKLSMEKLKSIQEPFEYFYLVPIASTLGTQFVDLYFEIIDDLRIFEWNIFQHYILEHSCLDIDGVLCEDPVCDDDDVCYKNFLKNAKPLYLPSQKVDTLVTCRLEKYRKETECWLLQNNVGYNKLIMLDLPSKADRIKWGKYAEYKSNVYLNSDNCLFIESSYSQAQEIARLTNKYVYCVETNSLFLERKLSENVLIRIRNLRFMRMFIGLCRFLRRR